MNAVITVTVTLPKEKLREYKSRIHSAVLLFDSELPGDCIAKTELKLHFEGTLDELCAQELL